MNRIDRYIAQVERGLVASNEQKERLLGDLRAHIEEALAVGETEHQVLSSLGQPEEVAAAYMSEIELVYAGFFERLFAFIADFALCLMLVAPGVFLAAVIGPRLQSHDSGFVTLFVALFWLAFVACALAVVSAFIFYFPLLEARFGKTLGKQLMGIRVMGEEHANIGLGTAFLRRLSLYFEMLVPDALFIPFTKKKQRALDILAKTVVVREPGGREGWTRYLLALVPVLLVIIGTAAALVYCSV